ncbi:bifunctional K homology domain superfamily [Babesia duncani]|uniref:Bifunctional K homology domain superfamily n=1 Tax=Babesia duncani TaxID=323732 RepID=A0AAD9UP49_9APIC|nr:bifunctional K homology domain superfamily [Babesia duncani]
MSMPFLRDVTLCNIRLRIMYPHRRHFSIMEFYNKIRPPPPSSEIALHVEKQPEIKKPSQNTECRFFTVACIVARTIPYFGPNVNRQPVPLEVCNGTEIHMKGKSSLLNALVNSSIAAVSPKVNTTRYTCICMQYFQGGLSRYLDISLAILGIVASHPRRKFCGRLVRRAWRTLNEADAILLVVDAVKRPKSDLFNIIRSLCGDVSYSADVANDKSSLHPRDSQDTDLMYIEDNDNERVCESDLDIEEDLNKDENENEDESDFNESDFRKPVALVLNKIDLASEKKWVKSRRRELWNHGKFSDVFYTSAKYSLGLEPIFSYLKRIAKPGSWIYPSDMITTQTKVQLVEQLIRACIYCWFNKDVPYRVGTLIIGWTRAENGVLVIEGELHVRNVKMVRLVCGTSGRIVKQIERNVSFKLCRMWQEPVMLRLHVKARPNLVSRFYS